MSAILKEAPKPSTASAAEPSTLDAVPYAMPAVERGDVVFFWRDPASSADPHVASVGLVTGVHNQVINLVIYSDWESGGRKSEVRHASDPALQENAFLRKNGAWDYSPQHKRAQVAAEALEKRVLAIAEQVATRIVNEMLTGTTGMTGTKGK